MKLLIVESPAKAKTISKYLGKEYTVRASVGHIRDLPKNNREAIDIKGGFVPKYEISKGKEHVVQELSELAQKADEIILATDADREGEAIAWHIDQLLKEEFKKRKSSAKPSVDRVTYHEITKEAIQEALHHPRPIDQNLRRAQEARRVLDRLVGYDLSGLIWKKVRYGLSAGRVQSPALRIIMEREREIRAFIPQKFFVITAKTETSKKELLSLIYTHEPGQLGKADDILKPAKENPWKVKNVTESEAKRSPRPPYITSTIQQSASSRFGFAPARTMRIAQKLYEAGLITYMRTDSTNLAQTAKDSAAKVITQKFGAQEVYLRNYAKKVKNAQEAHEAIRPTDLTREAAGGTPEEKKLYHLIWKRTIASQMRDALMMRTKITASYEAPGAVDFIATGSRVISPGWLLVDPVSRGEDIELPKVSADESLNLIDISSEDKQTEPPNRYTEAGLIKELEKRGIGRPSTYASTMKTLDDRGYVIKEGKTLKPTDVGEVVSTFLEDNFSSYISDTFTAEMENELDEIAGGTREYEKTLKDFYTPFSKDVKIKSADAKKITDLGPAPAEFKCPICGGLLIWKLSRGGKFMSCKRFPDCDGALTAEGKPLPKSSEPIGTDPQTGQSIFVKTGRFGPYLQLGEKKRGSKDKPRMASIPKEIDPSTITVEIAQRLLSLPRVLGKHPDTGQDITASRGRFGPFIVHEKDFRSLKAPDNPYDIALPRAIDILKEPKKQRGFKKATKK